MIDAIPEPTQWNGDPPAMPSVGNGGSGLSYRCLQCTWTGKDALGHHREAHHRIVLRDAASFGPVAFSCCQSRHESGLTEQDVDALAARAR